MTEQPGYRPDEVLRGLSFARRVGYAMAGLGGSAGAAMLATVWATEPAPLPTRTQLAFAALIAVGVAWGSFAAWALTRRPLFAIDRLVGATLATVVSALTTVGVVAVALARASTVGVMVGLGIGLALTAIAAVMLARARTYRALLLARKRELEPSLHNEASTALEETPMSTRKMLPIGPLAVAMRHSGSPRGRVVIVALIAGVALIGGLVLLLR